MAQAIFLNVSIKYLRSHRLQVKIGCVLMLIRLPSESEVQMSGGEGSLPHTENSTHIIFRLSEVLYMFLNKTQGPLVMAVIGDLCNGGQ